jgi:hypothetical protein
MDFLSWLKQGEQEGKLSGKRVLGSAVLVVATVMAFKGIDKTIVLTFAGIGGGLLGLTAIPKA